MLNILAIMTAQTMKQRLMEHFDDASVDVTDLTGTADHYAVSISSDRFLGQTRIACQRLVMAVFAEELKTGEVHALTIKTSPKEPQK
jgi:stress-induced morphogen